MLFLKTSNKSYQVVNYMDSTVQYDGEHNMEACIVLDNTIDFDSLVVEMENESQIQVVNDSNVVVATYVKNDMFDVERIYHSDEDRLEIRVRHMYSL